MEDRRGVAPHDRPFFIGDFFLNRDLREKGDKTNMNLKKL